MSKYILLTGGTGFIGSNLLEKLLNQDKKVILLKRSFSNTWRINEFFENDNLILKDIDKIFLEDIFSQYNIEGIFHLAAFSQRTHETHSVSKMIDSNIKFPTNLLEYSINSNCKYFINTGSFFEYEFSETPIHENSKVKAFNLYGSTKIAFENILKYYSDNYNLKCSSLKLFTPYGPKDDINKIIPYLIINSIKKNNITIKSPNKKLDFIHVNDIINAYITVMNNINKFNTYESYNIGTNISTSIKKVLCIIEEYLGKNDNITFENLENDYVQCCNKKIKKELNWNYKINLEDGIKLTIDFYKKSLEK